MNIAEKILRAKADYDAVFEAGKKAVGEVLKFTDVESTKYRTTVPSGVEPFARVKKIGGMTYKTDSGLISASVSGLKSEGANQFDINAEPLDLYNTNMTRLADGLKVNTTQATSSTTSNFYYRSDQIPTNCKKAYFSVNATPIGKITKGLFRIWIKDKNGNYLVSAQAQGVGNLKKSIDIPKDYQDGNGYIQILLYSCSGEICDAGDGVIYNEPMLSFDVNVPYTKYKGNIDTLSVSEAVKSLDGYGLGVNADYYNYIDFGRKVFVQRVKSVDMGTLSWGYRLSKDSHMFATNTLSGDIQGQISSKIPINALAADYRAVTVDSTWVDRDMAYSSNIIGNKNIEFVDNRYTDADAFKNAVNGKILVYALAEPIETDISAYLTDEYIEVEGGGTITAVNEYGYDAPTNISYLIDTQGG